MKMFSYDVVVKRERNGAFSAFVRGLPVYAAADTRSAVVRAIRAILAVYLQDHRRPVKA